MAKSGYDFYLDRCLLPIPPDKLTIKINNGNSTVKLINEGEINILKNAELTDIDFECMLPQSEYPFAVYKSGFREASYFLNYFEMLKINNKPFQFIVCRNKPNGKRLFNTNIKVSMESYTITEDAKQGYDIKVKIKLKQWRDYGTKTVKIAVNKNTSKAKATPQPVRANSATSPVPTASSQAYTVEKGDCLFNIAKKYYGDGSKYTIIYNVNKNVIGSNPNLIYPGQVLTIPAV